LQLRIGWKWVSLRAAARLELIVCLFDEGRGALASQGGALPVPDPINRSNATRRAFRAFGELKSSATNSVHSVWPLYLHALHTVHS
jgi:hypothetical protein